MKVFIQVTYLLLPLFLICSTIASAQTDPSILYMEGLEARERGNYIETAEKWIEYSEKSGTPDYRVGYQLIQLVTRHRMTEYYVRSSEVYFWGLKTKEIDKQTGRLLIEELNYLEPILEKDEANELRDMIMQEDEKVFRELEAFWNSRTLTPSDQYNERLLEHWVRVNHAQEHFNTAGGERIDDRGEIFIRFGEPNRKRSGIFMYNPGFANYVITTRMDDGRGQGTAVENAVNTTMFLNTHYQAREYHQYPRFEVWIYEGLTGNSENSIFIFGNHYGGNEMSEMQSIDDFIPSAAFSMTARNNPVSMNLLENSEGSSSASGIGLNGEREDSEISVEDLGGNMGKSEIISPALVLQLMYYRQLADLDIYFSSRYEEMLDLYMNTSMRLSQSMARQFQQVNTSRILISQQNLPDEQSSYLSGVYDLSTEIYPYQFFDDQMESYIRLYFREDTEEIITFNELKKRSELEELDADDYEIVRTVRVMEDPELAAEKVFTQPVNPTNTGPLDRNMVKVSVSDHSESLQVTSELYAIDVEKQSIASESTFRESLMGQGQNVKKLEIRNKREDLFFSDIIIGYATEETESETEMRISHERVIPLNKSINLYYEAYNLQEDESGLYSFYLTYEIRRDRSSLGRLIRFWKDEATSMTIHNTHDSQNFSQLLEIVSEQLKNGEYILELHGSHSEDGDPVYSDEIAFSVE